MGDQISRHVELAVKPGQLDNFRTLTGEMVESTRAEPGVLSYQRFVSDDGKFVYACERYANSAAAVAHLRKFGKHFSGRFLAMGDRMRFTVFGHPSDELRGLLDGLGATYLKPFDDFAYWAWTSEYDLKVQEPQLKLVPAVEHRKPRTTAPDQ